MVGSHRFDQRLRSVHLVYVAAYAAEHPEIYELVDGLENVDAFLAHPGSTALLEGYVRNHLSEYKQREMSYEDLRDLANWLSSRYMIYSEQFRAHFAADFTELRHNADGPAVLAAALKQGLLVEYDWPAMQAAIDELISELSDDSPSPALDFHPSCPWIGVSVRGSGHVIFVKGDQRGPEATFVNTQFGDSPFDHSQFLVVGDAIVCRFDGQIAWSDQPSTFEPAKQDFSSAGDWTFETNEGRLAGGGIVRAGEKNARWEGTYLTDGENYWRYHNLPYDKSDTIFRVDPTRGRDREESVPEAIDKLTSELRGKGYGLGGGHVYWLPDTQSSPNSALISRDGIHGWIPLHKDTDDYKYILPNGEIITGPPLLRGALERPGGGRSFLRYTDYWSFMGIGLVNTTVDESFNLMPFSARRDGDYHWLHWLPVAGFTYATARDEETSRRLRAVTAADVTELYNAVASLQSPIYASSEKERSESFDAAEGLFTDEAVAAAENLTGSSDSALINAIIHLTARVKYACGLFDAFTPAEAPTPALPHPDGTEDFALRWYEGINGPNSRVNHDEQNTAENVAKIAALLSGVSIETTVSRPSSPYELAFTHPELLITLAVTPGRAVKDASATLDFAEFILDKEIYTEKAVAFIYDSDGYPEWRTALSLPGGGYTAIWLGRAAGISPGGVLPRNAKGVRITPTWTSSGLPVKELRDALRTAREVVAAAEETGLIDKKASDLVRAEHLANETGWDVATAQLFLAGLPVESGLDAPQGFTEDELHRAHARFLVTDRDLIAQMLIAASANPKGAITNGLDIAAAAQVWQSSGTTPLVRDEDLLTGNLSDYFDVRSLRQRLKREDIEDFRDRQALAGYYMEWAQRLPFDSPARQWLADEMEWLVNAAKSQTIEFWNDSDVTKMLGLGPCQKWTGTTFSDGPWTVTNGTSHGVLLTFQPSLVENWDAELLRLSQVPRLAPIYAQLPSLQEYAQWLRTSLSGDPHDPAVSAPSLVDDSSSRLNISTDASRYYLQLLALHDPTDANVQQWNGWNKKQRVAAAQELLERGLIVEARRPRARRSYFLPGG